MDTEKRKSRSISLSDYYDALQFEFLSYYMRYSTYERDIDKQKYFEFCKKKKTTIKNISRRRCLPNIFDNEEYRLKKLNLFFNETGLPNFVYRDDHQRKHLGFWDKIYYFKPGQQVTYTKCGTIWTVERNFCKFEGCYDFIAINRDSKPTIKVNVCELKVDWDINSFNFNIFE